MNCLHGNTPMASDFHTHIPHPGKTELLDNGRGKGPLWSLSFHPWYTAELPQISAEEFERCSAVGEIGFDKCRKDTIPQERQLNIFTSLLKAADEHKKPVVLHWLGAYDKLFQSVKNFSMPILFHGYAKHNTELLNELLSRGFYVSISPRLAGAPEIKEFLKTHPGCRVGMETDDRSDVEIEALYDSFNIPGFENAADEHFRNFLQI